MKISLAELQLHSKILSGDEDLPNLMKKLGCDQEKSQTALIRGNTTEALGLVNEAFAKGGHDMQSVCVEEATDEQLNWILALCEGAIFKSGNPPHLVWQNGSEAEARYSMTAPPYTTHPESMVPIIEQMDLLIEKIDKEIEPDDQRRWWCSASSLQPDMNHPCGARAPTFLRAAAIVRVQTILGTYSFVPQALWAPGRDERPRQRG